ncbi:MAG: DUF1905 domain-containing protein [Acidobacteriota bacterium]|nr:DUF1905 domain-containing protein [Acidobacteriota bacterium]
MPAALRKLVHATLVRHPGDLGWTVAVLPFDPAVTWKQMVRARVCVEIAGEVFRTSLFPMPGQKARCLVVNGKMQQAAGAGLGQSIEFVIYPDLEKRDPEMPMELAGLLKQEKVLLRWYGQLSDTTRDQIGKWVEAVKSPESRQRRARQMAERLMLAMESERETPPILEAAFRRIPSARAAWQALTPVQRRGHLLGIFYYQTPESREKRTAQAIADALHRAAKADAGHNNEGD